jgi:uncharacterized protein YfiM (DUF2279 family)
LGSSKTISVYFNSSANRRGISSGFRWSDFLVKLLLIAISAMSLNANNFTKEEFWKYDKREHFKYSFAVGTVGTAISKHYGLSNWQSFFVGVGSSIILGWTKEVYDGDGNGDKAIEDIDANMLGAITGSALSAQFSWRF